MLLYTMSSEKVMNENTISREYRNMSSRDEWKFDDDSSSIVALSSSHENMN